MKVIQIGEICEILNGFAFKSENYVDSGIRVIRITNVQKGYIEDNTPVFCPVNSSGLDKYSLKEGDLLISLTGNVGRVAILEKKFLPAALNQRVACLRVKSNIITKQYLFYALNNNYFEDKCIQSSKGVAQKNMSTEWLKRYKIPLYSIEKQKKIIAVLDRVNKILLSRKQELQKLDELVQSRFIEMFENQEFHIISLDSIAEVTGGLTKNGKRKDMPIKYPYLRVANVYYNRLDLSEILEIGVKDNAEVEKALLKTDDLLFVEGNGSPAQIGRVALWNGAIEHCLHQNHLIKARLDLSKVNPHYVLFYFMSEEGREQIANRAVSTSGLYTLSVSKVAGLVLPIPPIELQNEFADFVKLTDKLKVSVQKSIDETQLLFDSLMQEYFG